MSMIKENAATTLATCAEQIEEAFAPYFENTIDFFMIQLNTFCQPEFK